MIGQINAPLGQRCLRNRPTKIQNEKRRRRSADPGADGSPSMGVAKPISGDESAGGDTSRFGDFSAKWSRVSNQTVVPVVTADPIPRDSILVHHRRGAVLHLRVRIEDWQPWMIATRFLKSCLRANRHIVIHARTWQWTKYQTPSEGSNVESPVPRD
jgi:hypothetical protein